MLIISCPTRRIILSPLSYLIFRYPARALTEIRTFLTVGKLFLCMLSQFYIYVNVPLLHMKLSFAIGPNLNKVILNLFY